MKSLVLFLGLLVLTACGGTDTGNPSVPAAHKPLRDRSGVCLTDTFTCPDSTVLERLEELDCRFPSCP